MDEYEKLDAVNMALKNEQKKINNWNEEIDEFNKEINTKTTQLQGNKKKISELQETVNGGLIRLNDYKPIHYEFMSGWFRCIEVNSFGEDKKQTSDLTQKQFLEKINNEFEPANV